MPVVWSFVDDRIFGEVTRLFGDREPLEVELVAGDKQYPLTPPDSGPGRTGGVRRSQGQRQGRLARGDLRRPDADPGRRTGKLDKGVAAGLYDLPKTKIRIKDCPTKEWFTRR